MALELWLIRHGETTWNAEKRIQGQSNSQLSELGIRQAQKLSERLRLVKFDHIYASDADRAIHTASLALPGVQPGLDSRLREIHFGILEGKRQVDFSPEEAEHYAYHRQDPYERRIEGGECWRDLGERVESWLKGLPSEGRVLAFSHGGTIRSALFRLIGYPQNYEWTAHFANTGITRISITASLITLITVNDHGHLEGLYG